MFHQYTPEEEQARIEHSTAFAGFIAEYCTTLEKSLPAAVPDQQNPDREAAMKKIEKLRSLTQDTKSAARNFLSHMTLEEKKLWYIAQIEYIYTKFMPNKTDTKNRILDKINSYSAQEIDKILTEDDMAPLAAPYHNCLDLLAGDITDYLEDKTKDSKDKEKLCAHLNISKLEYQKANEKLKLKWIGFGLTAAVIVAATLFYFQANLLAVAKGLYGLAGSFSPTAVFNMKFLQELPMNLCMNAFSFGYGYSETIKIYDVAMTMAAALSIGTIGTTFFEKFNLWESLCAAYKADTGVDVIGKTLGPIATKHMDEPRPAAPVPD